MTPIPTMRATDTARSSAGHAVSDVSIPLASATAGDHVAVQHLLRNVFLGPTSHDFQAQLDEPTYEPRDRLLVKHGERVVSHLRLIRREMRFGSQLLPITNVADAATSPEYCGRGYATALLESAERRMVEEGSVLGLLYTDRIQFYRKRGWTVCGRHSYSVASPHGILSHLRNSHSLPRRPGGDRPRRRPLRIRYWRRFEQAALMRLYQENVSQAFGAYLRTEANWLWIANRGAYDRIYVAIDGPPQAEPEDAVSQIVGYAVTKAGRIVEMCVSPKRPEALTELLSRVCSDAIESDQMQVRLDAAPGHPLHSVFVDAGGRHGRPTLENGRGHMVRLLAPEQFAASLHSEFLRRAQACQIRPPVEIGVCAGERKLVLRVTRQCSELAEGHLGRRYLTCSPSHLVQMLLGQADIKAAIASGHVQASTRSAADVASALLPELPLWHPAFDDLPA